MTERIELGWIVRDSVTGFEGVATVRYEYLTGCTRIGVQPTKLERGEPVAERSFDEPLLIIVKRTSTAMKMAPARIAPANERGGPRPVPPRR